MSGSPSLLGAAVLHGLVPVEDVHAGRVRIRSMARSNAVHAVERAGSIVGYVKQAGLAARLDGDDTAAVEAGILSAVEPLGLAPRVLWHDRSGVVWLTAAPGVELADGRLGSALSRRVAVEVGVTLARLHQHAPSVSSVSSVPLAPRPWPLLDALPASMTAGAISDAMRAVIDTWQDPGLHAALDTARHQWQPTHLVHGDMAAGNILIELHSDQAVTARFIDFELGGLGCPDIDLASATALFAELAPRGIDLAAACADAYWGAGGPASLTAPWRCVRALMTAWQVAAHASDDVTDGTACLLALARQQADEVIP